MEDIFIARQRRVEGLEITGKAVFIARQTEVERGRRQGREEKSNQAAMFDVEFIPWRAKQS